MKKILLISALFLTSANTSLAAFSLWDNTITNKLVGNCYLRADENIIFRTITYNEVCDPQVYEIDTAQQHYYSQPQYSQPQYAQQYQSYYPQHTYYDNQNYVNYLDFSNYYQSLQAYVPSFYNGFNNSANNSQNRYEAYNRFNSYSEEDYYRNAQIYGRANGLNRQEVDYYYNQGYEQYNENYYGY